MSCRLGLHTYIILIRFTLEAIANKCTVDSKSLAGAKRLKRRSSLSKQLHFSAILIPCEILLSVVEENVLVRLRIQAFSRRAC